MNERIRELYRQANEQAHQQACEKSKTLRPQNNTVWNEFVPLFAELIVKECSYRCYLIGEYQMAHELSDLYGFKFDFEKMMEEDDE